MSLQKRSSTLMVYTLLAASLVGCGAQTSVLSGSAASSAVSASRISASGEALVVNSEIGPVTLGLVSDGNIPSNTPQYEKLYAMHVQSQPLPDKVDLRKYCPPVKNQGDLGSCTAFSSTALLSFYYNKQGKTAPDFSPLFVYYMERALYEAGEKERGEKTKAISKDTGASSYLAVYTLVNYGAAPEKSMPYMDGKPALKVAPTQYALEEAQMYRPKSFAQIKTIQGMKQALSEGHAFILGMSVYQSFMTGVVARTGKMITIGDREQAVGGHSVMAVGYDDQKKAFIIRNSWGADWGQDGYFEMPYEYVKPGKMFSCFTIL